MRLVITSEMKYRALYVSTYFNLLVNETLRRDELLTRIHRRLINFSLLNAF